jgi:hypothetical protein
MARKYSRKTVLATLRTHHGLISLAADALGCSRSTLYAYLDADPELAAVVEEERERLVDLAEDGLFFHLTERSPWAIALVLKTLGKSRGYGDRAAPGSPLDGREDLSEWPQIQYALLQALEPYPEARWAVAEALKPHASSNGHHPSP